MISASVREAVRSALGAEVTDARALSGGSINDAYSARLSDGREVFIKEHQGGEPSMFPAEARGLKWLEEAKALRIPEVLAVSGPSQEPFLALELIRPGRRSSAFAETLGRGLAQLHRYGSDGFGLDHDNFIGRLPQANEPADAWPDFYRARRIEPMVEMAAQRGLLSASDVRDFDSLGRRLPELVGDAEPPARLHGDLWGGNLHVDEDGEPCLIDPAVFGGHREMDLAMMQLFGGFEPRVFAAYSEEYPLGSGWRDRMSLYQLYYLLVHVNLFGGSYVGQTRSALREYL